MTLAGGWGKISKIGGGGGSGFLFFVYCWGMKTKKGEKKKQIFSQYPGGMVIYIMGFLL